MTTQTRSPTPCASRSRHSANASVNRKSSPLWPARATASTLNHTSGATVHTVDRARLAPRWIPHLPAGSVRLRLTLLYSGLFLVSGVALLATTYLLFRGSTGVDLIVPTGTRHGVPRTGPPP